MSIISEALKKAREARGVSANEAVRPAPPRRETVAQVPPALRVQQGPTGPLPVRRRSTLGPILAMALVAVAAALGVFALGRGGAVTQTAGEVSAAHHAGNAQFGVEQIPLPRKAMPLPAPVSGYSLTGIAAFQDHFVAVVNGHVVKAGDPVGEAEVVAISEKAVELDVNGERLILEKTF